MNSIYVIILLAISVGFLFFPFVISYGNDLMVVTSDSMIPTLNPYDLIIVDSTLIDDVNIEDLIAFDTHIEGWGIVVHRIIEKTTQNDIVSIRTQGDNVEDPDSWVVHEEDFIGKVVEVLPSIGILLIDPIRYSFVVIIIITALFLLKETISESKIQKNK